VFVLVRGAMAFRRDKGTAQSGRTGRVPD